MATRKALFAELAPLVTTFDDHPWAWARGESEQPARGTYASRWNAGKDLSFTPLRPERVVEVRTTTWKTPASGTQLSSSGGARTGTLPRAPSTSSSVR